MTDIRTTAKPGPTFDGESMRAILDGRKTQTRRVLKGCREGDWPFSLPRGQPVDRIAWQGCYSTPLPYRIGQVYYARESLCKGLTGQIEYRSDGAYAKAHGMLTPWPSTWKDRPTSSFAMPRWAARVFLRITDVRVQRLGEISEEDAIAEGIHLHQRLGTHAQWFAERWEFINDFESWERDRNKWVAAYTFEVLKGVT